MPRIAKLNYPKSIPYVASSRILAKEYGCGKLLRMKILCVDIGTGTQDIYLYDSYLDMENNFKLVVPSPTMMVRKQIIQATEQGVSILISGVMMGGGPSTWATEGHLKAGLKVFATAQAARTFNDDLAAVQEMGVMLVSDDEAQALPQTVRRIRFIDFDFHAIANALKSFGISLVDIAAVVVGVFDHGNAPVGISDRKFRFDYLDERIRTHNRLSAFAYRAEDVPNRMTRLQAVVDSTEGIQAPMVVMDTAPAAVLGASLDPQVAAPGRVIIANVGNFHTLAFRLGPGGIEGLFEHHTGLLDTIKMEALIHRLAEGTLKNDEVFEDQGHGALIYDLTSLPMGEGEYDVVVTGPRRNIFRANPAYPQSQSLRVYSPAPFGDMMITGCFGLLAAVADVMPELAAPIRASLYGGGSGGIAPWDVD